MAICQKQITSLIVLGQNSVVFQDCLSDILDLVEETHWTVVLFEGSPDGGEVDVVGEEEEES